MVKMRKKTVRELEGLIDKAKPKTPAKKKATKKNMAKKGAKTYRCGRCNRIGHESKDCHAKTKIAGTGVWADLERRGLPKR